MRDCMAGRAQPIIEMLIPSTLDDSLAPPGQHVASLFCQHVAPQLPRGESWDSAPRRGRRPDDRYRQRACAQFQGFGARPADHEPAGSGAHLRPGRRRHLSRRAELDQMFSARPVLGHGNYRGPLPGLYMCGSGTHPGGGVTGAPGHNAAREVLADFRRRGMPPRRGKPH